MGTYYTMGGDDEKAMLDDVIEQWHPELKAEKVEVRIILASRADGEPAVRHAGYPALATVRIVPLKDRLTKGYDAELLVSDWEFRHLSDKGKKALLDHEMTHLRIARDKKTGRVKRDDLGRPKLKTRKGDWNAGDGFKEVCARHGEHAIEFENLRLAFGRAQEAAKTVSSKE